MNKIDLIGFDADDTLWENAAYFAQAEQGMAQLLSGIISASDLHNELYAIEKKNMEWYGYGAMAYTLSLIETAIKVSHRRIKAEDIEKILTLGRSILEHPLELADGIDEVLSELHQRYRLIMITKGDILDQERKLKNSGLMPYFHHIEIVTEKYKDNYLEILKKLDVAPESFLMVGNSLKSDILPVLEIGGQAIHIPSASLWEYEHCDKPQQSYREITHLKELLTIL